MLVDSCLTPEGEPAALQYLESIGVEPSESVCLVLVTHWDDDHIAGVARIVEDCEGATVACSLALRREEIFEFILEQGPRSGQSRLGRG
jgi:glyoxylase-like metal-dependent hydrolase (beta-lactamase superfamily II)